MDDLENILSNYLTTKDLVKMWGVGKEWIFKYLQEDRIKGAKKIGNRWFFPKDVQKPKDLRFK